MSDETSLAATGVDELLTTFAWALGDVTVGLSVLDGEGRLVRVNDALCLLLGRPEGDLLGTRVQDLVPHAGRGELEARLAAARDPGGPSAAAPRESGVELWQGAAGPVEVRVARRALAVGSGHVLQQVAPADGSGFDRELRWATGLIRLRTELERDLGVAELGDVVAEALVELLGGGAALLAVDTEDDSVLEIVAIRVRGEDTAADLRQILGFDPLRADRGAVRRVLGRHEPVQLLPPFAAGVPGGLPPEFFAAHPLGALLLLPLGGPGRPLGLLALGRPEGEPAYTPGEVALASRVSQHVGGTLQRGQHLRLEDVTARRAAAIDIVTRTCDEVLSQPHAVLQAAARAVGGALGLPCLVWLVDDLARRIGRFAVYDEDEAARAVTERALREPLADGLLARVLRDGRAHLAGLDEVAELADRSQAVASGHGMRPTSAIYGLRLEARGNVLGVIALHDARGPLSVEQRRLVDALAERVSLALDNAVLLHSATERGRQQAVLAEVGAATLTGDLPALFELVVSRLAQVLDLPWCGVLERAVDGSYRVLSHTWTIPIDGARVRPSPGQGLAVAARTGRPVVVPDYALSEVVQETDAVDRFDVRSGAVLPLHLDSRIWGAVTLHSPRPRQFSAIELDFFEGLTTVLEGALQRQSIEARQVWEATHDRLTGLPNRALLRQDLDRALHAGSAVVALLLLDLDDFKDVNDSLGHGVGDDVLAQLGRRLQAAVGTGPTVARLGGDEFAVCLTGCSTELEAVGVADQVVRAMHVPFALPGLDVTLSTSIGIAVSSGRVTDPDLLLRHADMAMYRAKSARTGWALYDAAVDRERAERLSLVTDLRTVLQEGGLVLHYQPLVDLRTGVVEEVEALVRWPHAVRGMLPPLTFVALAEQTGLIDELTLQVARQAAAQATAWRRQGRRLNVAVNVSPVVLRRGETWAELRDVLTGAEGAVSVEVTESALVDAEAQRAIGELAAAGIRCAVDDFGSGYSALVGLKTLAVSRLKLDRDFTAGVDVDRRSALLIGGTVRVAHALGLDVVAEGVETEAVAEALRALDVDVAQGYHYSPGVPADRLPLDRVPLRV